MKTLDFVVSLRTFSIDVGADEICATLALKPRWVHRLGEPRTNPAGLALGGVYKRSYCLFPITREANEDLADLLERMSEELLKYQDLFLRIRAGGGRSEFFIGWYSTGNTGGTFGSSLLRRLGDLGIDLALDVYGETETVRREDD